MSFYTALSLPFRNRVPAELCFYAMLIALAPPAIGQSQVLLGDTKIERTVDRSPSGIAKAFPFQAATTGQVNSASVYLDSSNRAPTVWVGMYANRNGHPQALMSQAVISNPSAGQWNSVKLPPVQVTRGTTYWLALLGVNGQVGFRDSYGRCRLRGGKTSEPSHSSRNLDDRVSLAHLCGVDVRKRNSYGRRANIQPNRDCLASRHFTANRSTTTIFGPGQWPQ